MNRSKMVAGGVAVAVLGLALASQAAWAGQNVTSVNGFGTDEYRVWFDAGRHTVIVDGERITDLDLHIYDSAGRRVDSDTDGTSFCMCNVMVWRPGYYTIRVVNCGSVYNFYTIRTN